MADSSLASFRDMEKYPDKVVLALKVQSMSYFSHIFLGNRVSCRSIEGTIAALYILLPLLLKGIAGVDS